MKKVLVGYLIDGKHSGIDKYLLNVLKEVSSKELSFDFLTIKKEKELEKSLNKKGAHLYEIPSLKHPLKQYRTVKRLIREKGYDIAYFNISEAFNCIAVKAAKDCGIKRIMVHSHSAGIDCHNSLKRNIRFGLHNLFRMVLYRWATDYLACSKKAGIWMYPKCIITDKKLQVIQNAVDASKFAYDGTVRAEVRNQMELNGHFVVGHIGNFCYQKNIDFLIEIIRELAAMKSNTLLLSIGTGPDMEMAKRQVEKYGLQQHVLFLGSRNDVPRLLQAMDIFLLPSRFEGLPIVGIEAQVAGLRVILSDTISEEVKLSENCIFVNLNASAQTWAKKIKENAVYKRISVEELKTGYCFDIKQQKRLLNSLFEKGSLEKRGPIDGE